MIWTSPFAIPITCWPCCRAAHGARAVPPEDVGGAGEHLDFLEVIFEQPQSEEAKRLREWARDDFKAELFDRRATNAFILRILYNKRGGK